MEEQRIVDIFQAYREINQVFFQILSKAASKRNLTALQLMGLRVLHENSEIRMSELAEKLNVGNSTISGINDRTRSPRAQPAPETKYCVY